MDHEEFTSPRVARAIRPRPGNHGGAIGAALVAVVVVLAVYLAVSVHAEAVAADQKCAQLQQDVRALQDSFDRLEKRVADAEAGFQGLSSEVLEMKIMQGRIQIVLDRLHADWSNLE